MQNPFRSRYRIYHCANLGIEWYEVAEWKWYWPFWSKWGQMIAPEFVVTVRFETQYEAREAIRFRSENRSNLSCSIIERL